MDTFFMIDARRLAKDAPSMKLHELIDWPEITHKLKGLYKREASNGGGPEPYAPLSMFKLMLLGQWHNLSDPQLEQSLKMRIDFMVFTGLEPTAGEMPDATIPQPARHRQARSGAAARGQPSTRRQRLDGSRQPWSDPRRHHHRDRGTPQQPI